MPSTFFGLNIGKTGLYAYQAALDVTAHNITNTETNGYTRQVMSQQAGKAISVNSKYGMAGSGVNVTGVTQMRNEYYDMKFWKNSTMYGEYSTKYHYMVQVENSLNEINVEGFSVTFNSMFNSMQELMKNPSSLTVRTQLINFASSLTEYFNSLSTTFKSIQEECNFEIRNKVDQINSIAQQIASITKQINTLEVNGTAANDLRDQRALLVDELSEIANISVTEKVVGAGIGITSYVVKINGNTLVENGNHNTLKAVPRTSKLNQNDIDGLYDITWANGQTFDTGSAFLGGSIQALFEVRDGNNLGNFKGKVTADAGDNFITVSDANIHSVEKMNMPETGIITLGNRNYEYKGFEVKIDQDTGKFTYIFELKTPLVVDVYDEKAEIGTSIDYKGIPYYMDQMNEFIRTFAKNFNEIHREGKDLYGNSGIDFFNAKNNVTGRNYTFGPLENSEDYEFYDFYTFNTQTGSYYEEIASNQPLYGSYYFMTAGNFTISEELLRDPKRLVTATEIVNGVEKNDIIAKLISLKDDKNMFKQGAPEGFMQTLVAEIGIDTKKAENFSTGQNNILKAITNQRLAISGVDIDEEAMNLVRFQNAYNLSAKVITVMDEIYDKLINYMGA